MWWSFVYFYCLLLFSFVFHILYYLFIFSFFFFFYIIFCFLLVFFFFLFNDTATTEIYTLSLHDALPIWMADAIRADSLKYLSFEAIARSVDLHGDQLCQACLNSLYPTAAGTQLYQLELNRADRKSTRLNSSHMSISYAVFCLKKKKKKNK